MNEQLRTSLLFSASSLVASLPVAWFFRGLMVPSGPFGRFVWVAIPVLGMVVSGVVAWVFLSVSVSSRLTFWRGAAAASIALVVCSATVAPYAVFEVVPAAVLFVGWLVLLVGGVAGWLLGRAASPAS